jgi:hypothetical protein
VGLKKDMDSGVEKRYGHFKCWSCLKCPYLFFFSFFGTRKAEALDCIKKKRKLQIQPREGEEGGGQGPEPEKVVCIFFSTPLYRPKPP